jgi:hypothetical protein
MSDFKTRLLEEKEQLDEKISKLEPFIGSEPFNGIDVAQQDLLIEQLDVMRNYSTILEKRIELLG